MKEITEQLANSLIRISGDPIFAPFMSWLKDSYLDQSSMNNATVDDRLLRQGQGKALNLIEIITAIEEGKIIADRYKKRP